MILLCDLCLTVPYSKHLKHKPMLNKSIHFLIENKLVAVLLLSLFIGWGVVTAPFDWETFIF